MHTSFLTRIKRVAILLPVLFFLCVPDGTQAQAPTIIEAVAKNKPTATPPGWRVFITFSTPLTVANEPEAANTSHYGLYHADSRTLVDILGAKIATTRSGKKMYSMVELQIKPLQPGEFYQLYVTKLPIGKEIITKPLVATIVFSSTAADEEEKPTLAITAAEDREDANVYLAGEITRASGTDFTGSADIKLSYLFPADFWNRSHFFAPVFDLKANTNPEADPDSLKFGLNWDFLALKRNESDLLFKPVRWKNSFLVEAERDFENANFTWGNRFVAPSRVLQSKNKVTRFYLKPFAGLELGKNLKSPVKEAENKGIARGIVGSTLNLNFFLNRKNLSSISLEGSYERRMLMLREVYFEKAEDDSLRAVFFRRNPREWIETKLFFNLTDSFGFYAGYEYGQLPPSYKLVDHRMKFGLTYKVKFKRSEE